LVKNNDFFKRQLKSLTGNETENPIKVEAVPTKFEDPLPLELPSTSTPITETTKVSVTSQPKVAETNSTPQPIVEPEVTTSVTATEVKTETTEKDTGYDSDSELQKEIEAKLEQEIAEETTPEDN